jgi:two-component system alkaline phosphatase synthesis response regulator PhoP
MAKANGNTRILIVEDERPIAHALELKLGGLGYDAAAVHNGQEAIERLGKQKYSLILLDLMMPKVDGFGVLAFIQKSGIKTPVIILTNLAQPEDKARAMGLGAKEYFVKADTSLATVVERVKAYL